MYGDKTRETPDKRSAQTVQLKPRRTLDRAQPSLSGLRLDRRTYRREPSGTIILPRRAYRSSRCGHHRRRGVSTGVGSNDSTSYSDSSFGPPSPPPPSPSPQLRGSGAAAAVALAATAVSVAAAAVAQPAAKG